MKDQKLLFNEDQTKSSNALLEKKHKRALEEIAGNPELIGLKGTFYPPEVEIPVFNSYEQVGEIDILLLDPSSQIAYYIEYKCNDNKSTRRKAKKQVLIAKEFADEKHRGKYQRLIYVFGNFHAKELIGEEWRDFF